MSLRKVCTHTVSVSLTLGLQAHAARPALGNLRQALELSELCPQTPKALVNHDNSLTSRARPKSPMVPSMYIGELYYHKSMEGQVPPLINCALTMYRGRDKHLIQLSRLILITSLRASEREFIASIG